MSLFLFSLLLSVVLGGQNLAFPDYSLAGNRPSQKSCNTGSPVVLNLWISEYPRKCQRSSNVLMSWASQPLTFLLCSSGLPGDPASLSLGLRHAFGLTATFSADQGRFSVKCQQRHRILQSVLRGAAYTGGFLNRQEMQSVDVKSWHLGLFWFRQTKEMQE